MQGCFPKQCCMSALIDILSIILSIILVGKIHLANTFQQYQVLISQVQQACFVDSVCNIILVWGPCISGAWGPLAGRSMGSPLLPPRWSGADWPANPSVPGAISVPCKGFKHKSLKISSSIDFSHCNVVEEEHRLLLLLPRWSGQD